MSFSQKPFTECVQRLQEMQRKINQCPSVKHLRRAGVEVLLAVRAGLDEAIKLLEPKSDSTPSQSS